MINFDVATTFFHTQQLIVTFSPATIRAYPNFAAITYNKIDYKQQKEGIAKDFRLTYHINWATTAIAIEFLCNLLPRLFIELAFYKVNKL